MLPLPLLHTRRSFSQFTETALNIPGEWFAFMAHAAYADFLRMDGQHDKALSRGAGSTKLHSHGA
jgi:hypothetical protein